MGFVDKLSTFLPKGLSKKNLEYFFALNIGSENLTAGLWTIEGKELKILSIATSRYTSTSEMLDVLDRLLDQLLGLRETEVKKILFGVPDLWLFEDDLKEEYLKMLKNLVKELELTPMAYVATSHALLHFLEKQEGVPTTGILVGIEEKFVKVTVARAGKLDGTKISTRSDNLGLDIEKALLTFTQVETLPSKIMLYGQDSSKLEKFKDELVSFPFMSKLSFLHFPKVEFLEEEAEIKSVCLAGAGELKGDVVYTSQKIPQSSLKPIETREAEAGEAKPDLGFVVGDVAAAKPVEALEASYFVSDEVPIKQKFRLKLPPISLPKLPIILRRFLPGKFRNSPIILGILGILLILLAAYLLLPRAEVKIFVEPQILHKDSQVVADPKQKVVDEAAKIIPGEEVSIEVSGQTKAAASGKKVVGDPAKGTVLVYNKTYDSKTISKGTTLASSTGLKFTLDTGVSIASQSATEIGITYGKATASITAVNIGADSNLPSGSELIVGNLPSSQVSAKAEGNFSGGTSKEVTVVSDEDQKRLLAQASSDLRRQAKQRLQEKLPDKKILEEALSEEIIKKSFSKNVNDSAQEFSLNLTTRYKGTAFSDSDLKMIVSKLVTTQVPEGFELNIGETETQADISKLEKDGRLVFLARFKAKLMPKVDITSVKRKIKGKTPSDAIETLKGMPNILGSEIKFTPSLPQLFRRLPILERNIKVEVGLK